MHRKTIPNYFLYIKWINISHLSSDYFSRKAVWMSDRDNTDKGLENQAWPQPHLAHFALEVNTGALKTHQVLVAHLVSPAQLQPV